MLNTNIKSVPLMLFDKGVREERKQFAQYMCIYTHRCIHKIKKGANIHGNYSTHFCNQSCAESWYL